MKALEKLIWLKNNLYIMHSRMYAQSDPHQQQNRSKREEWNAQPLNHQRSTAPRVNTGRMEIHDTEHTHADASVS